MDKIETPEGIFDRIWEETMGNDYATYRKKMIAELTSRDALLRADERQKAAERAIAYLWPDAPDFEPQPNELRAAIMAES